jgi:hypothetical protein
MMKRGILIMLVAGLFITEVQSQEYEKSNLSVGFNIGMDYNNKAYRLTEDLHGFTYYGMNPNLSLGLNFGYFVSKRFRPRFEVEYFYLRYGMNWNYGEDSDFDKTLTTVHYLGLNLHLDYCLYLGDRIQVYLSPGLITDLATNRSYKTFLNDDDTNDEYNVLSEQYPKALMGVSLSIPVGIKINDNLNATLEPEYTYYPYNFLKSNVDPYTRMSFKIGLEYTF